MNKALFLDRDGVINVDKNYVYKIDDFEFIESIFKIALNYQEQGYLIFVITNQAGIARGLYTENDFMVLTDWMINEFKKRGIIITRVYFCPHHPEYTGHCECRKPNPGMVLQAKKEFDLDLPNSILIGDKMSDIEAGRNAGIRNLYLKDHVTSSCMKLSDNYGQDN